MSSASSSSPPAASTPPFDFLAIEGNIGAGKTSLAHMLAHHYQGRLILEEFEDNTFLDKFYQNPERYAFPLEVSFLTDRYQQMQQAFSQASLFQRVAISDYLFDKSLIFAQNNLQSDQMRLFRRLFNAFKPMLPRPDRIVYLYSSIDRLQANIRHRGRPYEVNIKDCYLQQIQEGYVRYLKSIQGRPPVLVLETTQLDFVRYREDFRRIRQCIEAPIEQPFRYIKV
jgi:deoxyadenosine/deoxycytidine kinase